MKTSQWRLSKETTPGWIALLVIVYLLIPGFFPEGQAQNESRQVGETARFRTSTDLVRLSVSVTDNRGRGVTGLTRDDIEVFEDKVEQKIDYFIPDPAPLALGLVLDSSGSMKFAFKMERARAATLHFVLTSHPDDEVFLVDFDSRASLPLDFTFDREALAGALKSVETGGKTALYDAVYLALEKLNRHRTEQRKVILLITDGADTNSRYSLKDVRELARESDVQIYAVGILGPDMTMSSIRAIEDLAELSGGQAFFPRNPRQMVDICFGIALELHQQHILGYRSTNKAHDGEWRKVTLKIKRRKGQPRLVARTRKGYYARGRR